MKSAISVICLLAFCLVLCSCHRSNIPLRDVTQGPVSVASLGTGYVTTEEPVSIPNCSLMKVSVQFDDGSGEDAIMHMRTAFVEPDQASKITRKGQRVMLFEVGYSAFYGKMDTLSLARAVG